MRPRTVPRLIVTALLAGGAAACASGALPPGSEPEPEPETWPPGEPTDPPQEPQEPQEPQGEPQVPEPAAPPADGWVEPEAPGPPPGPDAEGAPEEGGEPAPQPGDEPAPDPEDDPDAAPDGEQEPGPDGEPDPAPDGEPEGGPDAAPECGDGVCDEAEACDACPDDCGDCWPEEWAGREEDLLRRLNEARGRGWVCDGEALPPAPPLRLVPSLQQAAREHARDMAEQDYVSNVSADGREFSERMADAGYPPGDSAGESVGAGVATAAELLEGLQGAPDPCWLLVHDAFSEVGIGYAFSAGTEYGHYWVIDLGSGAAED